MRVIPCTITHHLALVEGPVNSAECCHGTFGVAESKLLETVCTTVEGLGAANSG